MTETALLRDDIQLLILIARSLMIKVSVLVVIFVDCKPFSLFYFQTCAWV